MLQTIGLVLLGAFIGRMLPQKWNASGFFGKMLTPVICFLLFVMGHDLASNKELLSKGSAIIVQGSLLGLGALIGSVVFINLFFKKGAQS